MASFGVGVPRFPTSCEILDLPLCGVAGTPISCKLSPAYNKFSYYEDPATTSRFSSWKRRPLIDINVCFSRVFILAELAISDTLYPDSV